MSPDNETKLLTLTEENNQLLHKLRKGQQIQMWIRIAYFAIIFIFVYGGYLFVKPYLEKALSVYVDVLS